MEKATIKEIKEGKEKEKEDKQAKWVAKIGFFYQIIWKFAEKVLKHNSL